MRKEVAKGILVKEGFNIYRGCNHNCIYCDSRSVVYNISPPFEDVILKENAEILLEKELRRSRKKRLLTTGAMSDPYNHCELTTEAFRKTLEVILKYQNGIYILTKSANVLRDIDLITAINEYYPSVVATTLTTVWDDLAKKIEENVSLPSARIKALKAFSEKGIITGVWMCPLLPFICDSEENILAILQAVKEIGCKFIIYFSVGTTMREGSREYFYAKLDEHFPGLKDKYIKTYGNNYICDSPNKLALEKIIIDFCTENNIYYKWDDINELCKPRYKATTLFD